MYTSQRFDRERASGHNGAEPNVTAILLQSHQKTADKRSKDFMVLIEKAWPFNALHRHHRSWCMTKGDAK
jgi:hypothetical protein